MLDPGGTLEMLMQTFLSLFAPAFLLYSLGVVCGWAFSDSSRPGAHSPEEAGEKPVLQGKPTVVRSTREEKKLSLDDALAGRGTFEAYAYELDIIGIPNAIERLQDQPKERRIAGFRSIFARWAELEGATAFEQAIDLQGDPEVRKAAIRGATIGWIRRDPASVESRISKISDAETRNIATLALAQSLVRSAPEKAMELARNFPKNLSHGVIDELLRTLAERDPAVAMNMAYRAPERTSAICMAARVWGRRDPVAAWTWAEALKGEERKTVLHEIATAWTATDPMGAANAYHAMTKRAAPEEGMPTGISTGHLGICNAVLIPWTMRDWKGAYNWIQALPESEEKESTLGYLITRFLEQNAEGFVSLLKDRPKTEENDRTLAFAVGEWGTKDPDAALAWLKQQTDEKILEHAWSGLIDSMAIRNFEEALTLAEELRGPARTRSFSALLPRWADKDPASAGAWLLRQPEGEDRALAVARFVPAWIQNDEAGAVKWILEMPPGSSKDAATASAKGWVREENSKRLLR